MQTPKATASLPTFRKGVHCTEALRPLTRAVRFSTLKGNAVLSLRVRSATMIIHGIIVELRSSESSSRELSRVPCGEQATPAHLGLPPPSKKMMTCKGQRCGKAGNGIHRVMPVPLSDSLQQSSYSSLFAFQDGTRPVHLPWPLELSLGRLLPVGAAPGVQAGTGPPSHTPTPSHSSPEMRESWGHHHRRL